MSDAYTGWQRADRVPFHEDIGNYFRFLPLSPFPVFNRGAISTEHPQQYGQYADISGIDTLVVKVGTSILAHDDYRRRVHNMACLSEDLTRMRTERGLHVLLVSSGAIGLGRNSRLRRGERIPETELHAPEQKRRDAIEGQTLLFALWRDHLYPQPVEESLVTHDDITNPKKNARLFQNYQKWITTGKMPIINEDDARSLEEIDIQFKGQRAFGDNDVLASLHARLLRKGGYRPLLVLLSNTDGVYAAEPYRSGECAPIRVIKTSEGLEEQALPQSSARGRGGVISKIASSRAAASDGIPVVVANGQYCNHDAAYSRQKSGARRDYRVLDAILEGRVVGTRFLARDYALQG